MANWNDAPVLAKSQSEVNYLPAVGRLSFDKIEIPSSLLNSIAKVKENEPDIKSIEEKDYEAVWEPVKGSSQEFAIDTRAHHTLYCGARGPGKTITQLMRFRRNVGIGYGSYWRGVIFDREFKHLGDLVAQSLRFFPQFNDGCQWLRSAGDYKWIWSTGEELLFRHVKHIEDYDAFHGHEYPFIGWNELTKQPTSELYDKFMSVNRSSFNPEKHTPKKRNGSVVYYDTPDQKPLLPIPLEVFSTTNPYGPGHSWVKKRFIDVAKYGEIVRKEIKYFDPIKAIEVVVERTQVAIFGSFYENPYLDPVYRAGLIESCQKDPHLHAAWIEGDWSVSAGGAVDDLWESHIHIVDRFKVPSEWKVDRTFDWGSSAPFSVIWWAEANGEEVTLENGEKWCPQKGTLIAISESYGSESIGTNRGLKLSAEEISDLIIEEERILKFCGWISRTVQAGPADNQIRDVREVDVDTIESKMAKKGIRWVESDKSKGSRIIGLQLFRDRLRNSVIKEGPGVYFTRNCKACIEIIPTLPRDPDKPEDVDSDAEDHIWDAVRYRVLKGSNKWATEIITRIPH